MLQGRFRHFEIAELLGKGGMGEVYLAHDHSLERKVALKVLNRGLIDDPAAQGRLLDEARSCSRVQHPNIAAIYSIEEDGGLVALCLEYIEGQTLKQILAQGPMPLPHISRIGSAIASGMAAAHEAGIIHRDLKPANVMLTPRGEVKIMDFGLALRARRMVDTAGPATYGTVQYMSPEQARGEELTPSSDIFAFGSLLYEMVSGRPAFEGKNDLSILQAVNGQQPPPLRERRRDVPPALEHCIRRCLEKDPGARWASMSEVAAELAFVAPKVDAGPKNLISELAGGLTPAPPKKNRPQNSGRVGQRGQGSGTSAGWAMGNVLDLGSSAKPAQNMTPSGEKLVEETLEAVQQIRKEVFADKQQGARSARSRPLSGARKPVSKGPPSTESIGPRFGNSSGDSSGDSRIRRRRINEDLERHSKRRQLAGNLIGLALAFILGVAATVWISRMAAQPESASPNTVEQAAPTEASP